MAAKDTSGLGAAVRQWHAWAKKPQPTVHARKLGAIKLGPGSVITNDLRVTAVSRGLTLIGNKPLPSIEAPDSPTEAARSLQWAYVARFAGCEIAIKGLNRAFPDEAWFAKNGAALGVPEAIPPPRAGQAFDSEMKLCDFLDPWARGSHGDRPVIEAWLLGGEPRKTWTEVLATAKFLRNASVHGALSPTKLRELGIVNSKTMASGTTALHLAALNMDRLISYLVEGVVS